MIRSGSRKGIAPTAAQRLLLRAALMEGDAGRQAWEQWRREPDIERLDAGSQRLLPQLYRNVRTHASGDPLLERLKGVYRHTWSANGVLLGDARRLLRALVLAEVPAVVLDGLALITRYFRDPGARAVDSIAIMIAPDHVAKAARILDGEGWRAAATARAPRPGPYASQVRMVGGGRPVDLLWDPFPEACTADIRLACWASAEPAAVADVPCRMLAPADELLRICVRAARWEAIPSFRRLADALVLLRAAASQLDWDRLAHQATRARVVLPVVTSLSLLREVVDAPVPDRTLRQLEDVSVGAGEWLEQRLSQTPHPRLGRLPDLLFRYRRLAGSGDWGPSGAGVARFLQEAWGVRRPWQLPLVALGKGVRRAFRPA